MAVETREITPLTELPLTLVEGEPGQGKSNTVVARVIDDYFAHVYQIVSPQVEIFEVEPLTSQEKVELVKAGYKVGLKTIKLIDPEGEPEIIDIPKGFIPISTVKIFANFHFYGIVATFGTMSELLEWLEDGTIRYCYLIIDEGYIHANAQETMKTVAKTLAKKSMQLRKFHVKTYLLYPHSRMALWQWRVLWTEHILCEYDKDTHMITLHIKKKSEKGENEVQYYAPNYWPFYWTDEAFGLEGDEVLNTIERAKTWEELKEEGKELLRG